VLEVLERLDDARSRAKALLEDVFLRLMRHRYPIGAVVDIGRVTVYVVVDGATHARVTRHCKPDISIATPEVSTVGIEYVALRADGSETGDVICFREPVLGCDYWALGEKRAPRDQLIMEIEEMQLLDVEQQRAPGPTP